MKDNSLEKYSKLIALRNLLKEVQQLSWNITQLDKKFPMEKAEDIGYDKLILAYIKFEEDILNISEKFEAEVFDDRFLENEVFPKSTGEK